MNIQALVFDAYGTLFDVHSVIARCESLWPGQGAALSHLWRAKQLEYSWLRSLMGRYVDFETITADALRHACEVLGLACDDARTRNLMEAYRNLATFPEVADVMRALGGRKRAILSNGSPASLDAVLSVDALKIYKPDPRVYQLAVDALAVDREHVGFVSSNGWDACGARNFGFQTFWINRAGTPVDALGVAPDRILSTLGDLLPILS
jgi:2-haloacid dehalogenase